MASTVVDLAIELGIGRDSLRRIRAGRPVQAATYALAEAALCGETKELDRVRAASRDRYEAYCQRSNVKRDEHKGCSALEREAFFETLDMAERAIHSALKEWLSCASA